MVLLLQCKNRHVTTKAAKSELEEEEGTLELSTKAYHINDTVTRVYYRINNRNLIYRRSDTGSSVCAHLIFHYRLLTELSGRVIKDSATFSNYDFVNGEVKEKEIHGVFNIKQTFGTVHFLDLTITDWNKKVNYTHQLKINKQNKASDENYLIVKDGLTQSQTHFLKGDVLKLEALFLEDQDLKVDVLKNNFDIALPPFSLAKPNSLKYEPDTTFNVSLSQHQFTLNMPESGLIHIKNSATQLHEGLTIYTYDETFPGVSNTNEMILCTRYIMNKQEFESCKNAANQKEAIDNFWIEIGGSSERAKSLLRSYYGRVQTANRNYTSYHQGWKTDRGMIYIIFGTPTRVYKNKKGEMWVYGQESHQGALRFEFFKTENPFSDNDYILERSELYKEPWYTAVEYWRQGHVFNSGIR
jgi:GWxTD domain-containing protein